MAYALFITRNDIIKNTPLQGAIDADALLPFVRTAQDKYLKNLLGTILFDYLKQSAQENADYYALRLQNYLIAYSTQIPQYLQSIGNATQIYPDQSNQYFIGLNL